MSLPEIKVFPDPDAVALEAAERFIVAASQAISENGTFSVALAGGSTPKAMFEHLAQEPLRSQVKWDAVEIYFGDERCVPPEHPESNYGMANATLLSKVPIAPEKIHRMRGEIEPNEAAKEYGLLLKKNFADSKGIDLVLLGMGDDGHTLSLFPGTAAVNEREHRVVANYAEHSTTGKSWRITMTAPFVNRSGAILVCVTGAKKAARVAEVLEGPRDPQRLPIQLIEPAAGNMTWLLDNAAAGM